jgi:hypothetical protein
MPLAAATSSPPERPARVGYVLGPRALSVLPSIGEIDPPDERVLDWPSGRCRSLWCGVIEQCLADSRSRSMQAQDIIARNHARAFLRQRSADLMLVLELAGIEIESWPRAMRFLEVEWARLDGERRRAA